MTVSASEAIKDNVTHYESKLVLNAPETRSAIALAISMPSYLEIAQRAFDIYVQNGRNKNNCKENWQQAMKEFKS